MTDLPADLRLAIQEGRRASAVSLTQTLLEHTPPLDVLKVIIDAMEEVARRYSTHEIFVPEVLVSARAMESAVELLAPKLAESGVALRSTIVLGTVEGDLHDIGKNLIAMILRGANFKVVDLGVNVPPAQFAQALREHGSQFVALSALLTTTLSSMKNTVAHLRAENLPGGVKIMVGGAPVTRGFADEIGADFYAPDAVAALSLVNAAVG